MAIPSKTFSKKDASLHNSKEDCWIVIDGKVYDVGSYLDDHPGGGDVILEVAGKDATDEFYEAGHSKSAIELLETFCIGKLGEVNSPKDNLLRLGKQYWSVPVAVVGISVVAAFLFSRNKH